MEVIGRRRFVNGYGTVGGEEEDCNNHGNGLPETQKHGRIYCRK